MGRCELDDNRLKEFSICDEFEIGVNITDDEISEMAKELLDLRKENMALQQTIDRQHETTISDLKLIGKLQQENKDWAEGAEISNGRIRQLRKFNDALDKENDNLKDIVTKLQIKNKDNEDQ